MREVVSLPHGEVENIDNGLEVVPDRRSQKAYHERGFFNGIEISVAWEEYHDEYSIFFPQIEVNDDARDKGIWEEVIYINTLIPSVAKNIFDYAVNLTQTKKTF